MAGDWIPIRINLHQDPDVIKLARLMGPKVRAEEAAGYLLAFWGWASNATDDGVISGVTLEDVEAVLHMPNFLGYLQRIGWLEYIEGVHGSQIVIPNWDHWLSESAKKRLKKSQMQRVRREAVLKPKRGVKMASTEEKRRVHTKESKPKKTAKRFTPPTVADVCVYCKSRKNHVDPEAFVDHYTSNGWKVGGKSPMKDWKAAVRTWERRKGPEASPNASRSVSDIRAAQAEKLKRQAARRAEEAKERQEAEATRKAIAEELNALMRKNDDLRNS